MPHSEADPESFNGGDEILNCVECITKYKDVRPKKGVNKPFEKCFHVCGVFRIFFREGTQLFDIFSSVFFFWQKYFEAY